MRAADEDDDEDINSRGAGQRLSHIINNLANKSRHRPDCNVLSDMPLFSGDTPSSDTSPDLKPRRRRAMNVIHVSHPPEYNNNQPRTGSSHSPPAAVKHERLSPATPDTLSRSRSVTPSNTPPHQEHPLMTRNYSDTPSSDTSPDLKPRRRRAMNVIHVSHPPEYNNNQPRTGSSHSPPAAVKHERLSPATPDTLSRSRSVTPSNTPPHQEHPLMTRNYSDFMRSLAAKYNNANPNDYFRNGYPLLKPSFDLPLQSLGLQGSPSPSPKSKPPTPTTSDISLATAAALLNPFASPTPFPPLIDMSSTHALLAMVRTAKEAEVQGLLKGGGTAGGVKRHHSGGEVQVGGPTTPLDLSAGAQMIGQVKRARVSPVNNLKEEKDKHRSHEEMNEVTSWTVDDVCSFVSGIDICAEYSQKFRDQCIDGTSLPLLTEEHLTSTMGLKLGPALKLRSLLAKRTGSCSVCLHCVHCHSSPASATASASPGASPAREEQGPT